METLGIDIGIGLLVLSSLVSTYRMVIGPTEADRAVAGDLLMFGVAGLIALFGIRAGGHFTFDLVLIAAVVAFLSAVSLARALTKGQR